MGIRRKLVLTLAAAAITVTGCGQDKGTDSTVDTSVKLNDLTSVSGIVAVSTSLIAVLNRADDMAGVFVFATGTDTSQSGQLGTGLPPDDAVVCGSDIFALTSDYTDGYLSVVDVNSNNVLKNLQQVSSDATIRTDGTHAFLIQRGTGYGKVSKVAQSDPANVVAELTGLVGDNAHDIAFATSDKAYLSRYEAANMWIFNPATMTKTGEIDLSSYSAYAGTDSAGTVPSMSGMAIDGGNLFVACQRMVGWAPCDTSLVVVIDINADTVKKAIRLQSKNPYDVNLYNGKLYVACTGNWTVLDGGVEVINTTTLASEGTILSEADAGGDISAVTVVSDSYGYVITAGTWPNNYVKAFDPGDGSLY